jgi:hypothetical protein
MELYLHTPYTLMALCLTEHGGKFAFIHTHNLVHSVNEMFERLYVEMELN